MITGLFRLAWFKGNRPGGHRCICGAGRRGFTLPQDALIVTGALVGLNRKIPS
jgi:hypothetical protein